MKNKLRFLLPLCIAASMSVSGAFPVNAEEGDKPCLTLESGYAGENDIVFVDAVINGDTKAAAYTLNLGFDPSKLEFVSASSCLKGGTFYCNTPTDDSVTFVWSGNKDIDINGEMIKMSFKTRGNTAGETVSLLPGHCIMGSAGMEEIPVEIKGCDINVLKNFKYGDANCDGNTGLSDVVAITKSRVKATGYSLKEEGLVNGDTDNNKIVDEKDSENVLNFVSESTEEER